MNNTVKMVIKIFMYVYLLMFFLTVLTTIWELAVKKETDFSSSHFMEQVNQKLVSMPIYALSAVFSFIAWLSVFPVRLIFHLFGVDLGKIDGPDMSEILPKT